MVALHLVILASVFSIGVCTGASSGRDDLLLHPDYSHSISVQPPLATSTGQRWSETTSNADYGVSAHMAVGYGMSMPLPYGADALHNTASSSQQKSVTPTILLEGYPHAIPDTILPNSQIIEGLPVSRVYGQTYTPDYKLYPNVLPSLVASHYPEETTIPSSWQDHGHWTSQGFNFVSASGQETGQESTTQLQPAETQVDLRARPEAHGQDDSVELIPVPQDQGYARIFGHHNLPTLPEDEKHERRETASSIDLLWDRKGLSVDLHPSKLAAGITEIKLQLGISGQVGQIASRRVKREAVSKPGYYKLFQTWIRRYTKKVSHLRKEIAKDKIYSNDEQRNDAMYRRFRQVCPKMYNLDLKAHTESTRKQEREVDARALAAWDLLADRYNTRRQDDAGGRATNFDELTVEDIEKISRGMKLKTYTKGTTTEYLKKYMQKFRGFDQENIDLFSTLRTSWRQKRTAIAQYKRRLEARKAKDKKEATERAKGKEVLNEP